MIDLKEAEQFFNKQKNSFTFESKTINSAIITAWVCPKGHEWEQSFRQFLSSKGCQFCSGRKIILGENDIQTLYPHIASQIHPTKNTLNVLKLSLRSNKKIWWVCSKGHEWETTLDKRISRNDGCPYCSNRKIILGENDLATHFPHIASQIHPTKNHDREQKFLSPASGKKLWWLCEKGHEWETTVDARTSNNKNCPYCKNKKILLGTNDALTTHPHLKKYWDYEKNERTDFSANSKVKVYWQDSLKHSWYRSLDKQAKNNICPICSGRLLVQGLNDLNTTHPNLVNEWNVNKNSKTPAMFTHGSEQKVWWVCSKGHEWEALVNNRTKGTGCPTCWARTYQSKAEKEINQWLETKNVITETNVRGLIKNKELDIYIPSKKIAIEFNGIYWHNENAGKGKNYHYDKWKACKKEGIQLIQIWEDDWNHNPSLIKTMLTHKLNIQDSNFHRVFARETYPSLLTQNEVDIFLSSNHVQGTVNGGIRIGLFESNGKIENLVAVMVLKREPGANGETLNLLRYSTSKNVVGGFTKILKYVERNFAPKSVITFSDNTVSDGGLYENNGFKAIKEINPDYMYVIGNRRVHKFNYRLKRFREDPALHYEQGLSERELAIINNIPRIWDAGKIKWEKKY